LPEASTRKICAPQAGGLHQLGADRVERAPQRSGVGDVRGGGREGGEPPLLEPDVGHVAEGDDREPATVHPRYGTSLVLKFPLAQRARRPPPDHPARARRSGRCVVGVDERSGPSEQVGGRRPEEVACGRVDEEAASLLVEQGDAVGKGVQRGGQNLGAGRRGGAAG